MPERRLPTSTSTSSLRPVRRNLFHGHLSRRPTTSSTSTSVEMLRLDGHDCEESSEIVIRDQNGDFEVLDASIEAIDEDEDIDEEDPASDKREDEKERQRLADAVKHHRDRNRAPSEPAELLEQVKNRLRNKTTQLADDDWMYFGQEENNSTR
ncbi:hypothetical protein BJ878DRAFT_419474 [Calycina marina]|uniref:Uncharacterized protein n=1 Tax=Calycina marina TaxID=1763456 RepID=A0A9P7Z489_9HELO|nr:hypothetical protein BJ878DRAFT_419474 [Calycina marina]